MSRERCKSLICIAKAQAALDSAKAEIEKGDISRRRALTDLADQADGFANRFNETAIAGAGGEPEDD